jgi:hypothetical protein
MRTKPSKAWYALAVLVALVPVAWAGFDFGSQVRSTLDDIEQVPRPGLVVPMESGEVLTVFYEVGDSLPVDQAGCTIEALDGQLPLEVTPVDVDVEVTLFDRRWVAYDRIRATEEGRVGIRCIGFDAAVGPDVGENGLGIVSTFAGWTGRAALWVIPGLVLGAAIALIVALRRREPAT